MALPPRRLINRKRGERRCRHRLLLLLLMLLCLLVLFSHALWRTSVSMNSVSSLQNAEPSTLPALEKQHSNATASANLSVSSQLDGNEHERMRLLLWSRKVTTAPAHSCETSYLSSRIAAAPLVPPPRSIGAAALKDPFVFTKGDLELLADYTLFNATLLELRGRTQLNEFFSDSRVICKLALLYLENCVEDAESTLGCLRRLGAWNVERIMPRACRRTRYFAALKSLVVEITLFCREFPQRVKDVRSLRLGAVEASHLLPVADLPPRLRELVESDNSSFMTRVEEGDDLTREERAAIREAFYLPPARRPRHRMPPPLHCRRADSKEADPHTWYNLFPIGYALPRRPATTTYPQHKLFEFFPINPSPFGEPQEKAFLARDPYSLNNEFKMVNEWLYAVLLRYSMFGFTHLRGGWDCLRHQEYLYYGVVPVFVDLQYSPARTPSTIPRPELLEVLRSPMLAHIGFLNEQGKLVMDSRVVRGDNWTLGASLPPETFTEVSETPFLIRCKKKCNVNFQRPGSLYLEPYRAEHEADIAAGLAPPGTPLTFRAPIIQRHYHAMARPLWDLFAERYSAGAVVNYMLEAVGHPTPRRVLVVGTSFFSTDYTHETIVAGFTELGIETHSLVRWEADQRQQLSFVGQSELYEASNSKLYRSPPPPPPHLLARSGDPREVNISEVEERTKWRHYGSSSAYTSSGRRNPFLARRFFNVEKSRVLHQRDALFPQQLKAVEDRLDRQIERRKERGTATPSSETAWEDGDDGYDLVVYSVMHYIAQTIDAYSLFLLGKVLKAVPASRILFVDHNDLAEEPHDKRAAVFSHYGTVFIREMSGVCYTDRYIAYAKRHKLLLTFDNETGA